MDEVEINLWIVATIALVFWIVRLKWVNRKLRTKLRAQAALPAPPVPALANGPERDQEIVRLRDRVAVLERITVDKEHSLARQIDELRHG